MKRHNDTALYAAARLDTPFGVDPGRQSVATHPDDLLDAPGVHLKSLERDGSWPKFFGILVKHGGPALEWTDADVVVRSKVWSDGDEPIVWTGTFNEYRRMWMVD